MGARWGRISSLVTGFQLRDSAWRGLRGSPALIGEGATTRTSYATDGKAGPRMDGNGIEVEELR